jgi:hypothetical protein
MKIDFARAQKLLKAFDFPTLFREELGWEQMRYAQDVIIGEGAYHLDALANKRGFTALRCHGQIPPYATRRKIDSQVARSYHEHLIIYTDTAQTTQVWQWVKRQIGKPAASREHTFRREQSGQALLQKLEHLAVTLDDEEHLTILDVADKVRGGFDVERVTKRFYDRFKEEHAAFLKFVAGIPEEGMQRWYVSVTLNRLMFVYFIQKKGFLNSDPDYLPHKLAESQKKGKNRFYREFLCPLFFKGFACKEHDSETVRLLGKVPYLNGGIFAIHQIEELYGEKLIIPDKAFERLFGFFDAYQWHLDERPLRRDNEINPDVLGYIFEKYINQKQMGAYYTKEDITEYIGKNTVLPHLFDVARKECKIVFEGERSVWNLLQENPDRYIYPAIRKGSDLPLPSEIAAGIKDVSRRAGWNTIASEEFSLPTEIWREVVNRRQRYEEIKGRLVSDEIRNVNDLITYNLDIRQFAQDVIENAEGPELLRAFWKSIRSVTVLDPTVGSGAFLFAALNILEPLYEACLERMQAFVDELDASGELHRPEKFSDFRKVLVEVERHPNRHYFVLKSIIVDNLYGVDIMDEAVEICKLRLFLKLVAQVERADQVEPLPDIDFNIRAGNTLVGFATKEDVHRAVEMTSAGQMKLVSTEDNATLKRIEQKAEDVERLFKLFRQQQTELGGEVRLEDKAELRRRMKELEDELNIHLARQYGIHDHKSREFAKWRESHKPFHWFVDYYGIMRTGGFDIIIGNPPYVDYSKVQHDYSIQEYETIGCRNLYAYVTERSCKLLGNAGKLGLIVMLNLTFSDDFSSLRRFLHDRVSKIWLSSYDNIPDGLFAGSAKTESANTNKVVSQRVCIVICSIGSTKNSLLFSTNFLRWNRDFRPYIFMAMSFGHYFLPQTSSWLALGSWMATKVFERISTQKVSMQTLLSKYGTEFLQLGATPRYFISAVPEELNRSGLVELRFRDRSARQIAEVVLNSNLFYWYWRISGDGFHLTHTIINNFPLPQFLLSDARLSANLTAQLAGVRESCRTSKLNKGQIAHNVNYNQAPSVVIELDRVLARHYGLTAEELDFIINYDIKYRMGSQLEEEE